MIITDKVNDDTSLDACKEPPTLEEGNNLAAEKIPESENAGSEANNYFATEIEDTEDNIADAFYPLGIRCLT